MVRLLLLLIAVLRPAMAMAEAAPAAAEVLVFDGSGSRWSSAGEAARDGFLVVDLSDEWAPFLFSESDGAGSEHEPNDYRKTFIALANDRISPDEVFLESPAGRAAVLSTLPEHQRSRDSNELTVDERRARERARRAMRARRVPSFLEVYGIPPTLSVLARRVEEDSARPCWTSLELDGIRRLDFEITYQSHEQARKDYDEAIADA
ncbi:MAG: hypothetical protein ACREQ9_26900, partial [Candidatus Binatia bacterium]